MTVPTLEAIDDCFEGVIPSIIATVAPDGAVANFACLKPKDSGHGAEGCP
jgi:hypothetical protein